MSFLGTYEFLELCLASLKFLFAMCVCLGELFYVLALALRVLSELLHLLAFGDELVLQGYVLSRVNPRFGPLLHQHRLQAKDLL